MLSCGKFIENSNKRSHVDDPLFLNKCFAFWKLQAYLQVQIPLIEPKCPLNSCCLYWVGWEHKTPK